MGEDADRDGEESAVTVGWCAEKIEVRSVLSDIALQFYGALDFGNLEVNERRVLITTGMVFGDNLAGLFKFAFGYKKSRRLWDQEDARQDSYGNSKLYKGGNL